MSQSLFLNPLSDRRMATGVRAQARQVAGQTGAFNDGAPPGAVAGPQALR